VPRGSIAKWIEAFASHVRDSDLLLIVEGNGGSPVDEARLRGNFEKLSHALEAQGRQGLRWGVYCSDLGNVKAVAVAVEKLPAIRLIAYGYEPGFGKEFPRHSEQGWNFSHAIANVRAAKAIAAAAGKRLMVVPSGRALLEPDLQRFHWDYARLLTEGGADELLVQTQAWVRNGRIEAALDKLAGQLKSATVSLERVCPQVTVEAARASNQNGVDADTAFRAALAAKEHGFAAVSLWFAYADLDSPLRFLRLLESLKAPPRTHS
jgi:hypothetical protein